MASEIKGTLTIGAAFVSGYVFANHGDTPAIALFAFLASLAALSAASLCIWRLFTVEPTGSVADKSARRVFTLAAVVLLIGACSGLYFASSIGGDASRQAVWIGA